MTEAIELAASDWIWTTSAVLFLLGLAAWIWVAARILGTDDDRDQAAGGH